MTHTTPTRSFFSFCTEYRTTIDDIGLPKAARDVTWDLVTGLAQLRHQLAAHQVGDAADTAEELAERAEAWLAVSGLAELHGDSLEGIDSMDAATSPAALAGWRRALIPGAGGELWEPLPD